MQHVYNKCTCTSVPHAWHGFDNNGVPPHSRASCRDCRELGCFCYVPCLFDAVLILEPQSDTASHTVKQSSNIWLHLYVHMMRVHATHGASLHFILACGRKGRRFIVFVVSCDSHTTVAGAGWMRRRRGGSSSS